MTPDRWQQIDQLFNEALERRPEDRPAFLDTACAGDLDLRREIDSLLRHEDSAEGFLERPALHQAAAQLANETPTALAEPQISGYQIIRLLGEGGMGIVYHAQQTEPIHRRVALKLIKHGMNTRHVIARFEVERQALALMHHPHIAAVYDAGSTSDGRPYFVMEYVEGVPITDFCRQHRLSTRARLELFVDVCAAVQHAHQKGVIHRDLKPSNVLVSEEGDRPFPKIIDFGVAKAVALPLSERTAFTDQGLLIGTPEYMSPEQAALSQDIDTTTDVYSLGVLLYELLVGALPFDPKILRAAGYDEMRRIIRENDPIRPSARLSGATESESLSAMAKQADAGRFTRQLKGDLDWITLKALEKDRSRRYATVAAFAADVTHFLADEPITARAPSAVYRLGKFTRRYRGAVIAVTAVVLALLTGFATSLAQYVRAERQRIEADRQRGQAEAQRTAAEAAADEAATQRNAAVLATVEADRQRQIATREVTAANEAKLSADFQAYVATIAAADAELRLNFSRGARGRLASVPEELRGWEWHHLFLKTDTSLLTLGTRSGCENALANSAINTTLAIQQPDDRIYLKRCHSLDSWLGPAFVHLAHSVDRLGRGQMLAIHPDGLALIARPVDPVRGNLSSEWLAKLVNISSLETIGELGPFPAAPACADISADGARVAVGLAPKISARGEPLEDFFETWDVRRQVRLARMAPAKPTQLFDTRNISPVTCLVTFSPDSTLVASSGATVHVWRSETGAEVAADPVLAGYVRQPVGFSPDGSRLGIGRPTGLVDVLTLGPTTRLDSLDGGDFIRVPAVQPDTDLERRTTVLSRRTNEVLSLAFSRDGTSIISGTDVSVGLWDLERKKLVKLLGGHDAPVVAVAAHAHGRFVSADAGGGVRIWNPQSSGAIRVLPGFGEHGGEIALSRDASLAGIGQFDGGVSVWRLTDLNRVVLRTGTGRVGDPGAVRPILLTPDNQHLITSTDYDPLGTVIWWNLASGQGTPVALSAAPEPGCANTGPRPMGATAMALSPDGRVLAFRQGGCVVVREVDTHRTVAVLHELPIALKFHPDGSLLVRTTTGSAPPSKPRLLLWDWRANRVRGNIEAPLKSAVFQAQFAVSTDGRMIAIAGGAPASTLSIWDGNLQRKLNSLKVPANTQSVAFSPDGRRLATTSADTTVRIWDTERGQLLLILSDDELHTGGLAFTPDGRLIAGRSTGGLTIWEITKK